MRPVGSALVLSSSCPAAGPATAISVPTWPNVMFPDMTEDDAGQKMNEQ